MPMIDIDWLKDHVEVPEGLTYEQLAKDLVKVGLEEEEIHSSQVTGPIVVGYVVDATPEPQKNGKTINWCHVDCGDEWNETDEDGNKLAADEGLWFYTSSSNQMVNDAPEEQDVMVRGCRDAILTMLESEPSGAGYQNPGFYK